MPSALMVEQAKCSLYIKSMHFKIQMCWLHTVRVVAEMADIIARSQRSLTVQGYESQPMDRLLFAPFFPGQPPEQFPISPPEPTPLYAIWESPNPMFSVFVYAIQELNLPIVLCF